MTKSHSRGHEICFVDGKWYYSDTMTLHDDSRPCKRCNCYPTQEGYDTCLGYVDGVSSACCGHGVEEGYRVEC